MSSMKRTCTFNTPPTAMIAMLEVELNSDFVDNYFLECDFVLYSCIVLYDIIVMYLHVCLQCCMCYLEL